MLVVIIFVVYINESIEIPSETDLTSKSGIMDSQI